MMTIAFIIFVCACICCVLVSCIIIIIRVTLQMQNDSKEFFKLITTLLTPKPSAPMPPPKYLAYKDTVTILTRLVNITFQRAYLNQIIPKITNSEWKITMIAPSDKNYNEFIQSTVLQVFESIPKYLEDSVFFYYNVVNKVAEDDPGMLTLLQNITMQITTLLNNQIIQIGQQVENMGPTSQPIIDAIEKISKKNNPIPIKSPDGTPVSYYDSPQ